MSNKNGDYYFLKGGGEMGELIRAKDWSKTPLGDPADWPQSLCTMVAVMLDNPFGMYIAWGSEFIQLYNDGYRPILGATKHPQALGISTRETFSEIWHIIESMFDGVMKGKAIGFPDFMLPLNRNGFVEECYFDFSYSPIRKNDGEVGGVLVTVIETTNKKKAEDSLKESNERFRNTMKQAPVGITILRGPTYIVEMANDACLQLVDKTESEFVGNPLFASLPEVEEVVHSFLDNVLNTGVPYRGNEVGIPVNRYGKQDVFYFDFLYHPLKEEDGKISGVIAIVTEVTEKVETRKTIEERKRLYETITQNTPDLIYVFDLNYRFTYANEALLKMWGRTWEDAIGKGMLEVGYEPWQAEMHEREIDQVIATKRPIRGEVSFPHATLGKRIYDYIFAPIIDQDGKVESITGTTRDISDIKNAEEQLKKSEEQFSTLADNMENLAWLADGEGLIYWYNKRWIEYTGLTLEEMQGWGWQKVHHPDHVERILEISKKIWHINETFELTFPLRRHDGAYRWFLTRGFPLVNAEGKIIRWIGTNTDITERIEAEKNRFILSTIVDSSDDAIISKTLDGIITTWNKGAEKIFGYSPEEVIGQHISILIPHELLKEEEMVIGNIKQGKQVLHFETTRLTKAGRTVNISLTVSPLKDIDGTVIGASKIARDITEQVEARKQIEEREERFRSLAQTLPQLVWVTDAKGNSEFASLRWKEYSGIEPGGEKEWKTIVHPDDYDNINAAWVHSLTTGNIYAFDVRLKSKHGEYRWHAVKGEPVLDKESKIVKWVGAFTDIQDQKVREEKKDEFISIASHEMRTPLTTAKAYLQMLELFLDENKEDAKLYAKKASQSVNRLNELISELLDVSKIQLGKLNYTITTFNFNDMIESSVENVQLTSKTHSIIKTGKANDEVTGDKERLQQVIINLLTNAIKYSPGSEKVFINVVQENDSITVSVKDTGIGIAKQSLDKIFEKYHRVEEHAVHFQGLGIGLFISYEIIQRHHGKLWAESEPGKGSTFYFTIPVNSNLP